MHELGVLCQVIKKVDAIARENRIRQVTHITLEVGETSGYVPLFFHKLFPVAADSFPAIQNAQLRIRTVPGKGLVIGDIGYEST